MEFGIDNGMLFLDKLIDSKNNELTVFVTKVCSRKSLCKNNVTIAGGNKKLQKKLDSCMELRPDNDELYKIHFDEYIMYQMRNESYCSYDSDEIIQGSGLILFTKSKLMDNIDKFTDIFIAEAHYRSMKFYHYGIYTLDNIIDVLSYKEPTITKENWEDSDDDNCR